MTKTAKKLNIKERIDGDKMDLSLSDISEIPAKEIAAFKRANNVDLSNNRIAIIGPSIAMLAHLTVLDLSKNQITVLPAEIGKLINLRHLDLYNNRLDHLPIEVGKLRKLRYLDVKNNPLKSGIAQIAGQCLTTQECQLAAKKVVPFFAQMQVQIIEDRERLRKERDAQRSARTVEQQLAPATESIDDADGESKAAAIVPAPAKTKPNRRRAKNQPTGVEVESSNHSNHSILPAEDAPVISSKGTVDITLFIYMLFGFGILIVLLLPLVQTIEKSHWLYSNELIRLGEYVYKNLHVPLFTMIRRLNVYLASFVNAAKK